MRWPELNKIPPFMRKNIQLNFIGPGEKLLFTCVINSLQYAEYLTAQLLEKGTLCTDGPYRLLNIDISSGTEMVQSTHSFCDIPVNTYELFADCNNLL